MRHSFFVLASFVLAPFSVYACSSSTSTPASAATDAGADSATGDSAAPQDGSMPDAGQADTSPVAVIHCTQADFDKPAGAGGGDFTSFGGVDISFPTSAAPMQYSNHCAKVKVGSSVTFAGSFASHPLGPSPGAPANTPIPSQSTDTDAGAVTFPVPNAGTFGFECGFHPSIMFGALQVVP
jgi:plastocyanin